MKSEFLRCLLTYSDRNVLDSGIKNPSLVFGKSSTEMMISRNIYDS